MTIWGIADIHASPLDDNGMPTKPMDNFGLAWERHVERTEEAWNDLVADTDTVIVAGDIDWSLKLQDAIPMLERIGRWKGSKILLRGNHDYWWSSGASNKVRAVLPPSIQLLHNTAFQVEGFNIVGTKGSAVPGTPEWTEVEAKLLNRETERLKLSLAARDPKLPSIAALHYPPFFVNSGPSAYTEPFETSGVVMCIYGHLHGEESWRMGVKGNYGGIEYRLVAGDYLGFVPTPLARDGLVLPSPASG